MLKKQTIETFLKYRKNENLDFDLIETNTKFLIDIFESDGNGFVPVEVVEIYN